MEKSDMQSKVFKGLFWKFGERIFAQGISFIISIVLARILVPEEYGVVAMVNVFITIANVFVTSGLSTSLIQKKTADETDFSTIFYCNLVLAVILYIILFFSAPHIAVFYHTPRLTPVIRVFALKLILASYNSIQHAYVSRHMIFKKFFFSTLIGTVVSGVIGIIMAFNGFGVWALIAQYLVNSLMDTIVLRITIKWRPKFVFSWRSARGLINFGWKVLAADLIGTIYNQLRSLIIGRFYTSGDLAFYNRGKNFPELITNNIDATISTVLFPALSNEENNVEKMKSMARRSIRITSYVIFPMMIGMAVVARPMILLLLTDKWESCIIYLQLICIAKTFSTVSNANLQAMRALGRSDVVLKLEFIKKPIGLLMILLVVKVNVLAIAITMPIYSLFAAIINMQPNRRLMGYKFREQVYDLAPAIVLTLVMAIVIYPLNYISLPNHIILLIQIIGGILVYVILSVLFHVDSFQYLLEYGKNKLKKHNRRKLADAF